MRVLVYEVSEKQAVLTVQIVLVLFLDVVHSSTTPHSIAGAREILLNKTRQEPSERRYVIRGCVGVGVCQRV